MEMNELDDFNLSTLKTKNKKKDKVILKPIHSPLAIEKEYKAFINKLIYSFFIELGKGMDGKKLNIDYDDIMKMIDSLDGTFDLNLIKDECTNLFNKVSERNAKMITGAITDGVGVNVGNFLIIYNEEVQDFLEKTVAQNVQLIKSIESESILNVKRIITDGHLQGSTLQEVKKLIFPLIKGEKDTASLRRKARHRAETIAITETAKANSSLTQRRFKQLKIERVVWSATRDKRTRKCHMRRHGKEYDINKGLYSSCDGNTIHTGHEVRCRCAMLGVVE